jgi:hypothetical protein
VLARFKGVRTGGTRGKGELDNTGSTELNDLARFGLGLARLNDGNGELGEIVSKSISIRDEAGTLVFSATFGRAGAVRVRVACEARGRVWSMYCCINAIEQGDGSEGSRFVRDDGSCDMGGILFS